MLLIVVWALGVDDIIWKCPRGYMLNRVVHLIMIYSLEPFFWGLFSLEKC